MKILSIITIVAVLTVLIILINQQQTDAIKIGWIGPLTGDVSTIGISNKEGAGLAVEKINNMGGIDGKKLILITEDDEYNSKKSIDAFRKLVDVQNVDAVLMVTYGGVLSVSNIAESTKTVVIDSLDASDEIANAADYLFGIGAYDEGIGRTMADYTYNLGLKKAAVIFLQDDPYPILVKNGFVEKFLSLGGNIVATEPYLFGENDFRSRLAKIKENRPDVLVVIGYDEAGFAFRQAKELGLNITFFSVDTLTSKGFQKNAGNSIENAYFPFWQAQQTEKYLNFKKDFKEKYNKEPELELYSVTAYEAVFALKNAMAKSIINGKLDKEKLKENMYKIDIDGVNGEIKMDKDGIVRTIELSMYQFKKGEFIKVN